MQPLHFNLKAIEVKLSHSFGGCGKEPVTCSMALKGTESSHNLWRKEVWLAHSVTPGPGYILVNLHTTHKGAGFRCHQQN